MYKSTKLFALVMALILAASTQPSFAVAKEKDPNESKITPAMEVSKDILEKNRETAPAEGSDKKGGSSSKDIQKAVSDAIAVEKFNEKATKLEKLIADLEKDINDKTLDKKKIEPSLEKIRKGIEDIDRMIEKRREVQQKIEAEITPMEELKARLNNLTESLNSYVGIAFNNTPQTKSMEEKVAEKEAKKAAKKAASKKKKD